ncbi:hypothetical protein G7054_g14734 [Neopestalotiopsis clavispora]|nr:hypothetical protein G7054_g14734 [Neopestalotiopsis clavispora]
MEFYHHHLAAQPPHQHPDLPEVALARRQYMKIRYIDLNGNSREHTEHFEQATKAGPQQICREIRRTMPHYLSVSADYVAWRVDKTCWDFWFEKEPYPFLEPSHHGLPESQTFKDLIARERSAVFSGATTAPAQTAQLVQPVQPVQPPATALMPPSYQVLPAQQNASQQHGFATSQYQNPRSYLQANQAHGQGQQGPLFFQPTQYGQTQQVPLYSQSIEAGQGHQVPVYPQTLQTTHGQQAHVFSLPAQTGQSQQALLFPQPAHAGQVPQAPVYSQPIHAGQGQQVLVSSQPMQATQSEQAPLSPQPMQAGQVQQAPVSQSMQATQSQQAPLFPQPTQPTQSQQAPLFLDPAAHSIQTAQVGPSKNVVWGEEQTTPIPNMGGAPPPPTVSLPLNTRNAIEGKVSSGMSEAQLKMLSRRQTHDRIVAREKARYTLPQKISQALMEDNLGLREVFNRCSYFEVPVPPMVDFNKCVIQSLGKFQGAFAPWVHLVFKPLYTNSKGKDVGRKLIVSYTSEKVKADDPTAIDMIHFAWCVIRLWYLENLTRSEKIIADGAKINHVSLADILSQLRSERRAHLDSREDNWDKNSAIKQKRITPKDAEITTRLLLAKMRVSKLSEQINAGRTTRKSEQPRRLRHSVAFDSVSSKTFSMPRLRARGSRNRTRRLKTTKLLQIVSESNLTKRQKKILTKKKQRLGLRYRI